MGYSCKTIDYACAYGCASNLVQLKQTHCKTIAWVNNVRLIDFHNYI